MSRLSIGARVAHRREGRRRRRADRVGRRGRRRPARGGRLEVAQLAHERVVLGVGDLGGVVRRSRPRCGGRPRRAGHWTALRGRRHARAPIAPHPRRSRRFVAPVTRSSRSGPAPTGRAGSLRGSRRHVGPGAARLGGPGRSTGRGPRAVANALAREGVSCPAPSQGEPAWTITSSRRPTSTRPAARSTRRRSGAPRRGQADPAPLADGEQLAAPPRRASSPVSASTTAAAREAQRAAERKAPAAPARLMKQTSWLSGLSPVRRPEGAASRAPRPWSASPMGSSSARAGLASEHRQHVGLVLRASAPRRSSGPASPPMTRAWWPVATSSKPRRLARSSSSAELDVAVALDAGVRRRALRRGAAT